MSSAAAEVRYDAVAVAQDARALGDALAVRALAPLELGAVDRPRVAGPAHVHHHQVVAAQDGPEHVDVVAGAADRAVSRPALDGEDRAPGRGVGVAAPADRVADRDRAERRVGALVGHPQRAAAQALRPDVLRALGELRAGRGRVRRRPGVGAREHQAGQRHGARGDRAAQAPPAIGRQPRSRLNACPFRSPPLKPTYPVAEVALALGSAAVPTRSHSRRQRISASEARRLALGSQGFADPRPAAHADGLGPAAGPEAGRTAADRLGQRARAGPLPAGVQPPRPVPHRRRSTGSHTARRGGCSSTGATRRR